MNALFLCFILFAFLAVKQDCDDWTNKKQVHVEYDAMWKYPEVYFDFFYHELKEADTCKRLHHQGDDISILDRPEYLSNRTSQHQDSILIFLRTHRSWAHLMTKDSMYIYLCAVRNLVYNFDSTILGICYRDTLHDTVYNDAMCAIAVERLNRNESEYDILFDKQTKWVTGHELGHAFNLKDEYIGGCIMRTRAPEDTFFEN